MALVACEECGREISDKSVACVGCGAPTPAPVQAPDSVASKQSTELPAAAARAAHSEFRPFLWVSLILLSVVAVSLLWRMASSGPAARSPAEIEAKRKSEEQTNVLLAVKDCENRYAQMNSDRQYTPAELRAYAQVCEQIRSNYKAKWGVDP
ncbi:hypothetical protein [Stenotrophomonas lactitubi]|uniref:hypothetical protein n=1 Tax=Stenotrophomonas lactitubi TaxID=2045214 RepID=UPI001A9CA455|nr:hypothetical protein [Stenotrophomonas lactitubi]